MKHETLVLVSETSDDVIRTATPGDVARAKQGARVPVIGGYAYLARLATDAVGNVFTEGLTDEEIAVL